MFRLPHVDAGVDVNDESKVLGLPKHGDARLYSPVWARRAQMLVLRR